MPCRQAATAPSLWQWQKFDKSLGPLYFEQMQIKVSCTGFTTSLPIAALSPLQSNLKDLTEENFERLRKRIIERGITSPIHVWQEKDGNKVTNWILDGHQRHRVLKELAKENFNMPQVPVIFVTAASLAEAKEELLAQASQYGSFSKQGMYEYMVDLGLEIGEIPQYLVENFHFGGVDTLKFNDEFFLDKPLDLNEEGAPVHPGGEVAANALVASAHVRQVQLFMNQESHARFMAKVEKVMATEEINNITDAVVHVLDAYDPS